MWEFISQKLNEYSESSLFDEQTKISYAQVSDLSIKHGKNLKSQLSPKSICAILCESGLNCALSILACWYAGMIPVILSINYGERHCSKIIELVQPDILITDNENIDFLIFKYNLSNERFMGNKLSFDRGERSEAIEDVAIIMCTSGTTGTPKGALITQNALQENVRKISQYFNISMIDKIMVARPLYHCAVLTGEFLTALFNGASIGFFDDKYNPNSVLQFVVKNEISVLCGTPTLFNHLSMFIQRNSTLHNIKKIAISGECLSKGIAENIRKGFIETEIYNVYGLTEASPRVSYLSSEKFDSFSESVGVPLDGIKIKVVNKDYEELPANAHGLVMVNTPCMMKGYYNNNEATVKTILNGWLNTGDIGYKDENGYLYILSRADDMIIKGGMNIYPKEIENQIATIEPIQECVVYGEKTDLGQIIVVDIVLKSESRGASKKEIVALLAGVLPVYQTPSKINIVDSITRNASGKIVRERK